MTKIRTQKLIFATYFLYSSHTLSQMSSNLAGMTDVEQNVYDVKSQGEQKIKIMSI